MSHPAFPGPNLSIRCQTPNYVRHREPVGPGIRGLFVYRPVSCGQFLARGAHAVATFKVRSRISWLALGWDRTTTIPGLSCNFTYRTSIVWSPMTGPLRSDIQDLVIR